MSNNFDHLSEETLLLLDEERAKRHYIPGHAVQRKAYPAFKQQKGSPLFYDETG